MKKDLRKQLTNLLKELRSPMLREYHAQYAVEAMNEGLSYEQYLHELAHIECDVPRANKTVRLVKASQLPVEKTLDNFNLKRLPLRIRQQVKLLQEGSFVNRCENLLAFGNPGSGKTTLVVQNRP